MRGRCEGGDGKQRGEGPYVGPRQDTSMEATHERDIKRGENVLYLRDDDEGHGHDEQIRRQAACLLALAALVHAGGVQHAAGGDLI